MSGKAKKNGLCDAAGQRDQERRGTVIATEPSTTNWPGPSASGRQQVVDDEHEQAGEGEQDEDRGLRRGPQPGHRDDRGRGRGGRPS